MDLLEINQLINIRQYVINSTSNPQIDRTTVNYMNDLLLILDKKIIDLLKSDSFKEMINYQDIEFVKKNVVNLTKIKSSLNW